jgi:hypothetical protein
MPIIPRELYLCVTRAYGGPVKVTLEVTICLCLQKLKHMRISIKCVITILISIRNAVLQPIFVANNPTTNDDVWCSLC